MSQFSAIWEVNFPPLGVSVIERFYCIHNSWNLIHKWISSQRVYARALPNQFLHDFFSRDIFCTLFADSALYIKAITSAGVKFAQEFNGFFFTKNKIREQKKFNLKNNPNFDLFMYWKLFRYWEQNTCDHSENVLKNVIHIGSYCFVKKFKHEPTLDVLDSSNKSGKQLKRV